MQIDPQVWRRRAQSTAASQQYYRVQKTTRLDKYTRPILLAAQPLNERLHPRIHRTLLLASTPRTPRPNRKSLKQQPALHRGCPHNRATVNTSTHVGSAISVKFDGPA